MAKPVVLHLTAETADRLFRAVQVARAIRNSQGEGDNLSFTWGGSDVNRVGCKKDAEEFRALEDTLRALLL